MAKLRDFNKSKVDRVCHCGKTFKCQPWSKQVSCSYTCSAKLRKSQTAFIDEVGHRYNRLTVIRQAKPEECPQSNRLHTCWVCQCDCGNTKIVKGVELRNGSVKSCGCARRKHEVETRVCEVCGKSFEFVDYGPQHGPGKTCSVACRMQAENAFNKPLDLKGQRFGKLLVMEKDMERLDQDLAENKAHIIHWKCRCDCGKELSVTSFKLQHGVQTDCGCTHREYVAANSPNSALNQICHSIRGNAKTRDLDFNLTNEQVGEIISKPCHYCGEPPHERMGRCDIMGGKGFVGHGLDRVDSSKGYVLDNVVSCCDRCNKMKWTLSVDEFRDHIARLHARLNPAA